MVDLSHGGVATSLQYGRIFKDLITNLCGVGQSVNRFTAGFHCETIQKIGEHLMKLRAAVMDAFCASTVPRGSFLHCSVGFLLFSSVYALGATKTSFAFNTTSVASTLTVCLVCCDVKFWHCSPLLADCAEILEYTIA